MWAPALRPNPPKKSLVPHLTVWWGCNKYTQSQSRSSLSEPLPRAVISLIVQLRRGFSQLSLVYVLFSFNIFLSLTSESSYHLCLPLAITHMVKILNKMSTNNYVSLLQTSPLYLFINTHARTHTYIYNFSFGCGDEEKKHFLNE